MAEFGDALHERPIGIFPRIQTLEGVAPPWTPPPREAHSLDVIRVADLHRLQADRQVLATAARKAADILESAGQQAAAHVARVEQAALQERERWFAEQGRAFEARLSAALESMPDLVLSIVRAVIGSTLETRAEAGIRSSIDLAIRLLHAQVRRDVLCHPCDLEAVRAAAAVLEARSVEPRQGVEQGALTFVSPQGEVTVNGPLAMRTLVDDLQAVLRAALSRPPGHSPSPLPWPSPPSDSSPP
jgi:hypothetical protein